MDGDLVEANDLLKDIEVRKGKSPSGGTQRR
jgi:hypothetical protein